MAKFNLLLILFLACSTNIATSSRPFPPSNNVVMTSSNAHSMLQRLKLDHETPGSSSSVDCWASMFELQSCTGEVIQFFYEGETYLGPNCCLAIRVIEHHCWPNMLATLGFTSEEGDILQGYCDSEEDQQNGN
ncbi:egg cell-secreted protein 1.1-like [Chenopodium quinoa]|uniref:Prolamin-like domain-containing protein n=1 Tax=Chenopodium quinoa TaxID=63459 RepID=A0A803L2R7_CHEQI|nr:egg cell-secreted protein 1.1-like [Chenopodium quinoa]